MSKLLSDDKYLEYDKLISKKEITKEQISEIESIKQDSLETDPASFLKAQDLLKAITKMDYRNDAQAIRLDRSTFKGKATRTDAGYIYGDAVLTRTGIFVYRNADGSERRELRLPEEVFRKDSMESLKMVPVTHGHPYSDGGIVTPSNSSRLQKGHIGENIRKDDNDLMGSIMVTDESTITAIDNGNKDISCGYTCDLEQKSGEYNGERYDAIQRNIKYNHVAVGIPMGRAGNAKLNLDSIPDNVGVQILEKGADMPDLKKINLDGVEYEAEAPVLTALNTIKNDNAELNTKLDALTKEKEGLQAKLDTANEELEKRNDSNDLEKAVELKVELVEKAKTVLDSVDYKMSNIDIMKAVIKNVSPNVNLDGKSEDYIEARFDSVLEIVDPKNKEDNKQEEKRQDAGNQLSHREKMIEREMNAWKKESK